MNFIRLSHTYRFVMALLMTFSCAYSHSQNGGGKSSYSRFGLGLLNDQAQTWNKSMGGVGVALPSGNKLNITNPASYAYLDSLSFILDAGMSGNFGRMTMGNDSKNVNSAGFDYLVAGFRLRKNLGLSFGFKPYSTVDYNYITTSPDAFRDEITGELIRNTTQYRGTGGLNQVFAGVGWKPFSNFSIGTNLGIMWGGYNHFMLQNFTVSNSNSSYFDGFNFVQQSDVLTYKLDFGLQYAFRVSPQDWLTIGATIGIGHQFDGDAALYRFMTTGDTLKVEAEDNAFDIPMTYAGGIAWQHKNNLIVSADMHYQSWGNCRMPMMDIADGVVSYPSTSKMYKNNFMIKAGAEYTPNPFDTNRYYKRIKYRMGISYSSPYMNITTGNTQSATQEGPNELAVSLGIGMPISNRYNRSTINIGLQWLRRAPGSASLITENYFVLNLGVAFNESWFIKYKIR
ncbi:MAG: hypothetical protein NC113_08585 [Bacteroides sp.]|nr:hypothetical protein [Bacteroides sp.]MCM1448254.1 hypothetical protein [Bacteroides sp.]MCM1516670.1 hypothetical protein [Paraprevotella sp.]